MGTINPNFIASNERIQEISNILATGILRLKKRIEKTNSLDLKAFRRVHAYENHHKGAFFNEDRCTSTANAFAINEQHRAT